MVARLLVLLGGLVAAAPAQAPFAITGLVLDPSGAGVPNARVSLRRSGAELSSTASDPAGAFRLEAAGVGSYEVQAQHEGFKLATARVRIGSRSPAPLKITLALAEIRQEITVDSRAAQVNTNAAENLDTITLNRQALDDLPIFDNDSITTISRFLDAGAVATGGVTLIVDGVEANSAGVSASAIQELKINQNPYTAEFSRPGRGRIEIITKPGSTEYHGAFNFLFRDSSLNARDPFALTRASEQRRIFEGNITGPLGRKNKTTSFLISANREEEDLQAVVFAQGPGGAIRQNVPTPQRVTDIQPRITHQIGENHTISVAYQHRSRRTDNQGVGGFVLPEAGANYEFREDELFFNHRGLIRPKLLNQFRILFGRYHAPTTSLHPAPKIVVLDAFTGGGGQADALRTENHFALNEVLSWSSAKHVVKTGLNIPDYSRRGSNDYTNFAGTFYFSTLQDYLQNRPFSLIRQQGEGHLIFVEKVMGGFFQGEVRLRPNFQISAGLRYDWQNYFHDNNNFSPRLSFAWAPGKGRKTVLRGGGGFFYDRTGPLMIADLLRFDGQRLRRYVITNPSYPDPGPLVTAQPSSVVRLDPRVRIPYTIQYGLTVERQLQKSTTLTVGYLGTQGVSLFRSRDVNAPPPPLYQVRPDPATGVWRQIESSGRLESHSLEVALRGNITRFFNGMVQYNLGRAYNNTWGLTSFPANNYDLGGEWARADFDERHRFNLLGNIKPGKLFQLGVSLSLNSGAPYSLTTGRDDNHDGVAGDRPPGVRRNSLQGPGYADLDLRWSRDIFLAKARKDKGPTATVGLDAFNVLNRVNYASFVGNLSSPFFGHAVAARPARRLQASLRFKF